MESRVPFLFRGPFNIITALIPPGSYRGLILLLWVTLRAHTQRLRHALFYYSCGGGTWWPLSTLSDIQITCDGCCVSIHCCVWWLSRYGLFDQRITPGNSWRRRACTQHLAVDCVSLLRNEQPTHLCNAECLVSVALIWCSVFIACPLRCFQLDVSLSGGIAQSASVQSSR
jgi:hypothetical protein